MHDLDRTQNMFESNYEMEYEFEGEGEGDYEYEGEGLYGESESPLNEVQEMELAAELLEVSNEYELDHFLGKLISSVKKGAGGFLKGGLGKSLGGLLKGAAKAALPMIGNMIVPGAGGAVASKLGGMFGLELEGLSPQDQEFEAARSFVKFAGEAAQNAANAPAVGSPQQIAKTAIIQAAEKHAPGLLRVTSGDGNSARSYQPRSNGYSRRQQYGDRGRRVVRVRRGDRIMIVGV